MLTLGVIGVGLAIALVIFAILSQAEERSVVRSSLRQLDDYEVASVREKELLVPLQDRLVAPLFVGLPDLGKRFPPAGHVDTVSQQPTTPGKGVPDSSDTVLGTASAP